ncbi:hypothetical protein Hanom_Chr03g00197181 [Helianthus anomalus]
MIPSPEKMSSLLMKMLALLMRMPSLMKMLAEGGGLWRRRWRRPERVENL